MLSDAASSTGATYDPGPLRAGWKDEFWVALVGTFDAWLRSYYGIQELTDDPQCVLRIGPMPARMPVLLSDGTEIREGEAVGALHIVADSLIVWGLTRAFNPAALPRQRFLRDHNELWISRSMLLKLYGREARTTAIVQPRRAV